jgi:hypothetical protein
MQRIKGILTTILEDEPVRLPVPVVEGSPHPIIVPSSSSSSHHGVSASIKAPPHCKQWQRRTVARELYPLLYGRMAKKFKFEGITIGLYNLIGEGLKDDLGEILWDNLSVLATLWNNQGAPLEYRISAE